MPGTPVMALRDHAERMLAELKSAPGAICRRARRNCPIVRPASTAATSASSGRAKWCPSSTRRSSARPSIGVLPTLVATRYGFHIVAVERRIAGRRLPFDEVEAQVAALPRGARRRARALKQYVEVLAGRASIDGADLAGAAIAAGPVTTQGGARGGARIIPIAGRPAVTPSSASSLSSARGPAGLCAVESGLPSVLLPRGDFRGGWRCRSGLRSTPGVLRLVVVPRGPAVARARDGVRLHGGGHRRLPDDRGAELDQPAHARRCAARLPRPAVGRRPWGRAHAVRPRGGASERRVPAGRRVRDRHSRREECQPAQLRLHRGARDARSFRSVVSARGARRDRGESAPRGTRRARSHPLRHDRHQRPSRPDVHQQRDSGGGRPPDTARRRGGARERAGAPRRRPRRRAVGGRRGRRRRGGRRAHGAPRIVAAGEDVRRAARVDSSRRLRFHRRPSAAAGPLGRRHRRGAARHARADAGRHRRPHARHDDPHGARAHRTAARGGRLRGRDVRPRAAGGRDARRRAAASRRPPTCPASSPRRSSGRRPSRSTRSGTGRC